MFFFEEKYVLFMYNMTTFNVESKMINCFLNSQLGVLGVSVTKCGHRQSTFVYEYFPSDMEMILSWRKQERSNCISRISYL